MTNKVIVVDEVDKQVWELISNVPFVTKPVAAVCTLFNFMIPGFGTMIASCAS